MLTIMLWSQTAGCTLDLSFVFPSSWPVKCQRWFSFFVVCESEALCLSQWCVFLFSQWQWSVSDSECPQSQLPFWTVPCTALPVRGPCFPGIHRTWGQPHGQTSFPVSSHDVTSRVTHPWHPATTCTLKAAGFLSDCTAGVCRDGSLWPMLLCQQQLVKHRAALCASCQPPPLPGLQSSKCQDTALDQPCASRGVPAW